jgi:ferredoxin-NADP reductase
MQSSSCREVWWMPPLSRASVPFSARVLKRAPVATDVLLFELGAPEGKTLPSWEPGAHIELAVDVGGETLLRHYSLVGDPVKAGTWTIAVQLEPFSRGGSRAIHEQLHEGDVIEVRRIANHFPLVDAPSYVFLAAGIGLTPIVSLALAALKTGKPVRFIQLARSEDRLIHLDRWPALEGAAIERVVSTEPVSLPRLLESVPPGAAVVACGPAGLLDALTELSRDQPWTFHCERFAAPDARPGATGENHPFKVRLTRSGTKLEVPAEKSLLEVLLENDVPIDFSCREGICSTCEVGVVEGEIDHRDFVLDEDERARGDCMMTCVSRAFGRHIVLNL